MLCSKKLNSEMIAYIDEKSGREIIKLTQTGMNRHMYFTDNSFTLGKDEIIKRLCEISLGDDLSEYSQITLCESNKIELPRPRWKDINLLVLRKGNMYELIRTIDNKVISLNKMGEWKYTMDDETTELSIDSGLGVIYNISGSSQKVVDDYIDCLFAYDVGKARTEVEGIKKLVLERYSVNRDR